MKIPFKTYTDSLELANGVKIPCIGYGTWQTPDDVARESVKTALQLGYRHIDTAFAYGNEQAVGEGIKASGVARSDIFVTTKHWVTERCYEKTIAAVENSLKLLGLDYPDMYLVQWPCVQLSADNWQEQNAENWRGFERMYKDGKIRAIGVSNYEKTHLEALDKTAEIKPMVNQLEFHPGRIIVGEIAIPPSFPDFRQIIKSTPSQRGMKGHGIHRFFFPNVTADDHNPVFIYITA